MNQCNARVLSRWASWFFHYQEYESIETGLIGQRTEYLDAYIVYWSDAGKSCSGLVIFHNINMFLAHDVRSRTLAAMSAAISGRKKGPPDFLEPSQLSSQSNIMIQGNNQRPKYFWDGYACFCVALRVST